VRVEVARPATTVATTAQLLVATGREPHERRETLRKLIGSAEGFKNAIIFCNRKREVAVLHRSLQRHGFNAVALHGDMDQPARMEALDRFRFGEAPLLVASDVAARGLDIPEVTHVINFDVPHHADDYVHRIGRTGRAGRAGTAITLVAPADRKAVAAIETLIGQKIAWSGAAAQSASVEPANKVRRPKAASGREKRGQGGSDARTQPSVTRIDEARSRRAGKSTRAAAGDHGAESGSHLPAFLLRPTRA
jgi:superfamily II DNA/RNA helicase